jgi:hypothetical protein
MTLPRALTWMHLWPRDTAWTTIGGPDAFSDWARSHGFGGGHSAVAAWNQHASSLPSLDDMHGLVAINCRGLPDQRLRAAGFTCIRRFAVLPSLDNARWLIPLDSGRIASAGFCLYTPFRLAARCAHRTIRAVARLGAPFYRDQITIAQRNLPPLEHAMRALFAGEDLRLAISTGAIGPDLRRKPAVAVLAQDGRRLAFAKLAGSPVSRRLLEHEARVLPVLASLPRAARLAPRLLMAGDVDGTFITVQSPIEGQPVGTRLTPLHRDFLNALTGGPIRPALETALVRNLLATAARLPEPPPADVSEIIRALPRLLQGLQVSATVSHTDFVPWNLRNRQDALVAFDWDAAEIDGLPLYDELQHLLMVGYCFDHWSIPQAIACLRDLAEARPHGLHPWQTRLLSVVYVLANLVRLYAHGHPINHPTAAWYRQVLVQLYPLCHQRAGSGVENLASKGA